MDFTKKNPSVMTTKGNEFSSRCGYEDLDLEHGSYGSCGYHHCGPRSGLIGQRAVVTDRLSLSDIDDRTSLLNGTSRLRSNCIDARIFSLGVLFIGTAFTVGVYILQQDRPMWSTRLDLVNREDWGAISSPIGRRLSSNSVIHVLLHHTATENCFDLTTCKMFVYNYQKWWLQTENDDLPFNYLIGGDGRAYEARGWAIESAHLPIHLLPNSLSIALIGNFTKTMPSVKQLDAARSLISELKFQKKITKNYHIIGISDWKYWNDVFTALHS